MKKQYGYMLFKRYVRFIMDHILFRHHYILGRENMPKDGEPFIVPSNHQNADIDPVAIVLSYPQPVHPYVLTMGGVFVWNETLNKFWDWLGMLPAYRMNYEGVVPAGEEERHPITISGGISTYPCIEDSEEDANTIIRYAEHALYNAKKRGKNKIVQFSKLNLGE